MFFLNRLGTVVVGIWWCADAVDVSADARVPLEHAMGSLCPYARYFPFQSTKRDQLLLVIQTGHHSVLACEVRVCFSCTRGFGVAAGKQGWFAPVAAPPSTTDGASQERASGGACCSTSVKRTWWCLASILSSLLKFHVRGVLATLFKIPVCMFLKTTLTSEVSSLFF